jgi:sporulation protein YlmC with PRC-barrel domain
MIRLSELCGKRVVTEDGESLGCVYEIHIADSCVSTLVCGPGGIAQRLFFASHGGHRIRWDRVKRITEREIVVS